MWIVVLLVATALRLSSPDWDAVPGIPGTAIAAHPDERFLLGVAQATALWADPCAASPDFPYGHLPVYVARLLVMTAPSADPLVAARLFSGLVGVLLVAVTGAWGRALAGERGALLAGMVMAFAPFAIQQAHFYTVDLLGAVLVSMAILMAMRRRWSMAGALAGLTLACKVSLGWGAVVVVVGYGLWVAGYGSKVESRKSEVESPKSNVENRKAYGSRFAHHVSRFTFHVFLPMALAFAVVSPWALLRPVACWRGPLMQASMAAGRFDFPYTRQYAGTLPFVYPLGQMALWGLGPLATFAGLVGMVLALARWRRLSFTARVGSLWVMVYFLVTAGLYAKFPRYLLPLYPAWAAWSAWTLAQGPRRAGVGMRWLGYALLCGTTAIFGVAQVSVYAGAHPWIAASRWIYANVEGGQTIAVEAWDHPLPVPLPGGDPQRYTALTLPVWDEETPEKSAALADAFVEADIIVLASQRGYAGLARNPARYAATLDWYRQLLAEGDVVAFGRCPRIGPLALSDDPLADAGLPSPLTLEERCGTRYALRLPRLDESFRVYDAPVVLLIRR